MNYKSSTVNIQQWKSLKVISTDPFQSQMTVMIVWSPKRISTSPLSSSRPKKKTKPIQGLRFAVNFFFFSCW